MTLSRHTFSHERTFDPPRTGPASRLRSLWLRVGPSRGGEPDLRRPYKKLPTGTGVMSTKSWNEGNSKTVLVNVTLYGKSSVVRSA
jgi:hypothetical protein